MRNEHSHNCISDQDRETLRRLKRKVDNIRGDGVFNSPDGVLITGGNAKNGRDGKSWKPPFGAQYQVLIQIDPEGTAVMGWPRFH